MGIGGVIGNKLNTKSSSNGAASYQKQLNTRNSSQDLQGLFEHDYSNKRSNKEGDQMYIVGNDGNTFQINVDNNLSEE